MLLQYYQRCVNEQCIKFFMQTGEWQRAGEEKDQCVMLSIGYDSERVIPLEVLSLRYFLVVLLRIIETS